MWAEKKTFHTHVVLLHVLGDLVLPGQTGEVPQSLPQLPGLPLQPRDLLRLGLRSLAGQEPLVGKVERLSNSQGDLLSL